MVVYFNMRIFISCFRFCFCGLRSFGYGFGSLHHGSLASLGRIVEELSNLVA